MIAVIESDAFAVAMLAVIFSALGVVALLLLTMRWRASRRDPQVDALLEELATESRQAAEAKTAPSERAAWERDADWWRDSSDEPR
jgi:hypothetical protein